MFSLDSTPVKVSKVNLREEFHGEQSKLAADIKVHARVANTLLCEFSPHLLGALYKKPDRKAEQPELLENDAAYMPKLKFKEMSPFSWDWIGQGYQAMFLSEVGAGDLIFDLVTLDKFKIDPQDGGHVEIEFSIAVYPTDAQLGMLGRLIIFKSVSLTLAEPTLEAAPKGKRAAG